MRTDPDRVRRLLRERKREEQAGDSAPPALPGEVSISDDQVRWVEQVLSRHPGVRWTVFLMHKPAWRYESPEYERIEAMVRERPYTMIAGHEHYYNYSSRNGRDYVTMATTGGVWLTEGGGSFDHIAWVTMTDEGPLISNIALCGLLGTPGETAELMHAPGDETTGCFEPGRPALP